MQESRACCRCERKAKAQQAPKRDVLRCLRSAAALRGLRYMWGSCTICETSFCFLPYTVIWNWRRRESFPICFFYFFYTLPAPLIGRHLHAAALVVPSAAPPKVMLSLLIQSSAIQRNPAPDPPPALQNYALCTDVRQPFKPADNVDKNPSGPGARPRSTPLRSPSCAFRCNAVTVLLVPMCFTLFAPRSSTLTNPAHCVSKDLHPRVRGFAISSHKHCPGMYCSVSTLSTDEHTPAGIASGN